MSLPRLCQPDLTVSLFSQFYFCFYNPHHEVFDTSAALEALEAQMLVCVFVVCVCHTCSNCTKALNFNIFRLKDF